MKLRNVAFLVLAAALSWTNPIRAEEPEPVEMPVPDEVGSDLRTRRGYSYALLNDAEEVSLLYFLFDNGILQFYHDEASMGYVFHLDVSGLPDPAAAVANLSFEDVDGDGYGDLAIPLPDGDSAVWRWNAEDWTFEPTATSARLPASALTRKTLSALPAWTAPRMIVHIGELAAAASRLGSSWLLDFALDIRPERGDILEWLQSFPVESVSFVKGLSGEEEDRFQGAIRFAEEKQELLALLEEMSPTGEDGESAPTWAMGRTIFQLLEIPSAFLRNGSLWFTAQFADERPNLFELDFASNFSGFEGAMPTLFASVADAGGEKLLLFASSPEEVDRARSALDGDAARLEIVRRDPAKANFLQIADDGSGSAADELVDDLGLTSRAPAHFELSAALPDHGLEFSFRHNFFDVLAGDYPLPAGGWRADNKGYGFGGGDPWLAAALSVALTERNVMDFLTVVAGGDAEEAREVLTSVGIDPGAISGALGSIGLVAGGYADIHGREDPHPEAPVVEELIPGGYVFVSGDAEKMRQFAPLVQLYLRGGVGDTFRETPREGWDFFYVLSEELSERVSGLPFFTGMKDGVFLIGILDEVFLEDAPDIDWGSGAGGGSILRGNLDFSRLTMQADELIEDIPLPRLYHSVTALDLEFLFKPDVWSPAFRYLAALQEVERITVDMPDWNRIDIDVATWPTDYENVWKLTRTSRMIAEEE